MSRGRRILARSALGVGSLLGAALLLEFGVVALLGIQPKFPRHVVESEFGLRINQPYSRYHHQSAEVAVEFRINGQGMRADHDFEYGKPDGVLRIISLGDSFTIGYEVEAHETFSNIVESRLRNQGLNVEVLNAGVSGYSTAEACSYLERELLRYDPDLVLVSFFGNDLVDNYRADLFRLEHGILIERKATYVPGGWLGDFLNTNAIFSFLSERSNAFALLKERATLLLKTRIVQRNRAHLDAEGSDGGNDGDESTAQRKLAAAILDRIYHVTTEERIPFLIHSIPSYERNPERLLELFPRKEFDVDREGIAFLSSKDVLEPWLGVEPLYHQRSHGHWTPRSHALAGHALAQLIVDRDLLVSQE